MGADRIGTAGHSRSCKSSFVLVSPVNNAAIIGDRVDTLPAQIISIFSHKLVYNNVAYSNVFISVKSCEQNALRYKYGKALQIWSTTFSESTILPVLQVNSHFAPAFGNVRDQGSQLHVMFVCPLNRRLYV